MYDDSDPYSAYAPSVEEEYVRKESIYIRILEKYKKEELTLARLITAYLTMRDTRDGFNFTNIKRAYEKEITDKFEWKDIKFYKEKLSDWSFLKETISDKDLKKKSERPDIAPSNWKDSNDEWINKRTFGNQYLNKHKMYGGK